MAIQVNKLVDRAKVILQDTTGIRWPDAELLDWLNDGQREVVMLSPRAGAITTTMQIDPLDSKQSVPSDGTQFLRLTRNIGGRSIRATQREILDSQLPQWHNADGDEVAHYVFDPVDPMVFYVYPRADVIVELVYARAPSSAVSGGDLQLPDVYANSVLDYVLYRAYSKDAEETANRELANNHYTRFVQGLEMKNSADAGHMYQAPVTRASAVGS